MKIFFNNIFFIVLSIFYYIHSEDTIETWEREEETTLLGIKDIDSYIFDPETGAE